MDIEKLSAYLTTILGDELNDWEIDDLAEKISKFPHDIQLVVLKNIRVIWPVSYALFYSFVDQISNASRCLPIDKLDHWVHEILDVYESDGLRQAQIFMENVEDNFLCQIRGETGLKFEDIETRLGIYIRGLSDREIYLASASLPYTDTETIYLPKVVQIFPDNQKNFLIYKLTATFLGQLSRMGSFMIDSLPEIIEKKLRKNDGGKPPVSDRHPLEIYLSAFDDPSLAKELFYMAEAVRILAGMHRTFPGLMKDCQTIFQQLYSDMKKSEYISEKSYFLLSLRKSILKFAMHQDNDILSWPLGKSLLEHFNHAESVSESIILTDRLYQHCLKLLGEAAFDRRLPFLGILRPTKAFQAIELRRQALKNKFINAVASFMAEEPGSRKKPEKERESLSSRHTSEDGRILLNLKKEEPKSPDEIPFLIDESRNIIKVGGDEHEISEELMKILQDLKNEYGQPPDSFFSSSLGRPGSFFSREHAGEEDDGPQITGPSVYDEWDYRRSGYRKNWCKVIRKEILPTGGTFVQNTLNKYKGPLISLKRQFEMMVNQERFIKGQRDGDDIDLDSLIESMSDHRAGLAPSERLFIRLQKNERDIAALFLIDMSSSTEGWISTSIKESLILLCEVLSVLGDRYAIYGFSGMRRSRCEFFHVKSFDEPYNQDIKNKIAGISPKEYTRMGPAIRHAAQQLSNIDAKIRLLVCLSDGKPEDYDEYKGEYAIEDTRHALIEAKSAGIHPFCITVDREAGDYISHMYGEINYIFIDDVVKLPQRIPGIYRNLTT